MRPPPNSPGPASGPASGRRRARVAALAIALAGAVALAHAIADSPGNRERIRSRAEAVLRDRLGEARVAGARVDWLFRAELGPVEIPSPRPGAPPLFSAECVVVAPSWAGLFSGRVEPGSVTVLGGRLVPGTSGAELRRAWERARRPRAASPGAGGGGSLPSFHARGLTVVLGEESARPLEIGPLGLDASLRTGRWGTDVSAAVRLPDGGRLAVSVVKTGDDAQLTAELDASLPGDLPPDLAGRVPVAFPAGRIRVRVKARGGADLRAGAGRFLARATGLEVAAARLGPAPWGPFFASTEGDLNWDLSARRAALAGVRMSVGERGRAALAGGAEFAWSGEPRLALRARAEGLPFQDLVDALPPDLRPPEAAPKLSGAISARFDLSLPLARPGDAALDVELDLDDLRRAARAAGPSWLAAPFSWRPVDLAPGEAPRDIVIGPANPSFVTLAEMPPALVRAVTASEDAGFFTHRGFDFQEIAQALLEARGGRVRGASTITQQLAKNLFLSPDRTLSRKVREALATIALEAAVPKARLLEIYLNIAEWGPGVYGVGEAARYWFDEDPRRLTPKQAAFLASVIPSPRRFAARLRRAGVSPWWQDRISDILGKMWIQGQLSDEQLAGALDEPLRLRPALLPAVDAPFAVEPPPAEGDPPEAPGGTPEPPR